jgi:hypothetical protein
MVARKNGSCGGDLLAALFYELSENARAGAKVEFNLAKRVSPIRLAN